MTRVAWLVNANHYHLYRLACWRMTIQVRIRRVLCAFQDPYGVPRTAAAAVAHLGAVGFCVSSIRGTAAAQPEAALSSAPATDLPDGPL